MVFHINYKAEIEARSNEINYLINNEKFTRQEAIKLVLMLDRVDRIPD